MYLHLFRLVPSRDDVLEVDGRLFSNKSPTAKVEDINVLQSTFLPWTTNEAWCLYPYEGRNWTCGNYSEHLKTLSPPAVPDSASEIKWSWEDLDSIPLAVPLTAGSCSNTSRAAQLSTFSFKIISFNSSRSSSALLYCHAVYHGSHLGWVNGGTRLVQTWGPDAHQIANLQCEILYDIL